MTGNEIKMPVKVTPFDHQRRAFQFVLWLFGMTDGRVRSTGAALLMQMGTGKSLVGIAICGYLYLMKKIRCVMVVCPLSICGVWQEEFAKFANFPVQLVILNGTAAKKRQQIESLQDDGTLQVIVVNYESSWRLLPELQKYDADVIIADEGHKLKEGRTSQSKGMHKLGDKARYRLLLTGTPVANRELDIFSQYRFVNPDIFGKSFIPFRNRYFYMGGYEQHEAIFKKSMTGEFLEKLHSIAFRVTKDECLDLPEVTEEIRTVPVFSTDKVTAATQVTQFTLMKEPASSNLVPMPLDEFKPSKIDKLKINALYNHFRDTYDGHDGQRGRADQTMVTYKLLAPLVVAGEESADEAAMAGAK